MCVVGRCPNRAEHGLHRFPKDYNLRRQWVNFVQTTRADFTLKHNVTPSARICSWHFNKDDIQTAYKIDLPGFNPGYKQKPHTMLRPGAVPCIKYHSESSPEITKRTSLKRSSPSQQSTSGTPRKQRRPALRKLEVSRNRQVIFKLYANIAFSQVCSTVYITLSGFGLTGNSVYPA